MKERRSNSQNSGSDEVPRFSRRQKANGNGWPHAAPHVNGDVRPMLLDTWALAETVLKRWYCVLLGALIFGGLGGFAGWYLWKPYFTATAQLLRFEQQNSTEFWKDRIMTEQTFVSILQSPELIERVSSNAVPPLSPDDLKSRLAVTPARESDIVAISMTGETGFRAVDLANLYANHAVAFFRELQAREAAEANHFLTQQLAQIEKDIIELNKQLRAAPGVDPSKPLPRANPTAERLQKAQEELDVLLTKFTEQHPDVQAKQREVMTLKQQLERLAAQAPVEDKKSAEPDSDTVRSQLTLHANSRILLMTRQREAEQLAKNPSGYCRLFTAAEPKDVAFVDPTMKILLAGVMGSLGGMAFVIVMILLFELLDNRLKTVTDVKRVTRLPVIATLGDIDKMHPSAQANWAFRTWTAMQSRLSLSPNHGLVCGFTSSGEGQGRSTWIRLLAKAASQCGFRVLTITTLPSPPFVDSNNAQIEMKETETDTEAPSPFGDEPSMAVANNVLSTPAEVTEKLTGDNPQPVVHIPLPGWVWSLERRKQWQTALQQWRDIENIVILVELPPACDPEAVLLAENIPNVVWLSDGTKADATESREQLQTLRDARCNLVGAVVNRAQPPRMRKRFSRWVGVWPLLAGVCLAAQSARAQTNAPATPAPPANVAVVTNEPIFSASAIRQRSAWQQRLTLGPGDVLNISLYGQPEMTRAEVLVGPDGKVSYLQAADVMAAGLTVDEFRTRLDEELAKFYRSPRSIVTPAAYRSKKYYVLGKVVKKGVFTLDQPVTILEAVARAQGLETGLLGDQNTLDLADLQRSFLMRQNQRVPVNLEKLFFEGDLTQNIPLEPDDYLYFAPGNLKEVYVLGEVLTPGPVTHTPHTTLMGALTARGGYTSRAFKSRVLVVRGSLNRPQTFVVDTWATLDARGLDFRLEPKDIVYVHHRPFIRAEELLDLAASAFVQSATAAWAGKHIDAIIRSPILPQP